jgi:hypothetical protein
VNTLADTLPNAAFASGPAQAAETRLLSPAALVAGVVLVTFRHRYQLEAGFDGGVLEIAVNAGGFLDIVSFGGTFLPGTHGYSGTLAGGTNPLGARSAWTGSSGGWVSTAVQLPNAFMSGDTIRLRWRLGTDASVASAGWWVDTVSVRGVRALFAGPADFDGDGHEDIVAAAGPGGGPHVRVLSGRTGQPVRELFPFDVAFTGGVRVAVCDLDDDGVPDIVAGAGPGGGPHVRTFSGATGGQLPGPLGSFFPYPPGFTGGVHVGCTDVNRDLVPDVVTGAGAGGGPHVRVFSGRDGSVLFDALTFVPAFTGGVAVAP